MTTHLKVLMCISIATAILIVSAPGPINAQTLIEMSKLECKDYLGRRSIDGNGLPHG